MDSLSHNAAVQQLASALDRANPLSALTKSPSALELVDVNYPDRSATTILADGSGE